MPIRIQLRTIYQILNGYYGPLGWWPAETKFEMIVGAILTQNTSWVNVEKAIRNLKEKRLLTPHKLYSLRSRKLAGLLKPVGFFNLKAKRLRNFLSFLMRYYEGHLPQLLKLEKDHLRSELLRVKGIGPETADSIILYAACQPQFVVDAYTRRLFSRLGLIHKHADYETVQSFFMRNLPHRAKLFNQYHALIVQLSKEICLTRPKCSQCPLTHLCPKIVKYS